MILLLAKYRQQIAMLLVLVAELSFMQPAMAAERAAFRGVGAGRSVGWDPRVIEGDGTGVSRVGIADRARVTGVAGGGANGVTVAHGGQKAGAQAVHAGHAARPAIGGPSQPEMGSFKSVNVKDLVNLFTGQFNYNIPLLDVGGYPVNLYYNGEIGLEQDASWVGLGWNINPGTISRNMRGIPDDFNGQDSLIQIQNVKPNITWGINTTADAELVGIKFLGASASLTLGVSFNNYLGPALSLGVKDGIEFNIANCALSEKSDLGLGVSADLSASLSSRSGLTLSPSASLTASVFTGERSYSAGLGLATSYNSRTGIKSLQISEQATANRYVAKYAYLSDLGIYTSDGGNNVTNSATVHGSTISFSRPSYTPSMRIPMVNNAFSGLFQLGLGIFGGYGSVAVEAFQQTSKVNPAQIRQSKAMVGYMYYDQATTNPNAVTDFTRFNDREVTPNTPIISAPQYTYDVFTISGEGTGGSVRAYRNDLGYVRDNATSSQDQSEGVGADIGPPGHFGANYNEVKTPSTIGEWGAGNKLHAAIPFTGPTANGNFENVYFRNPGESTVIDPNAYTRLGGTNLVRFELDGDPHNPNIEPILDSFSTGGVKTGTVSTVNSTLPSTREKRTQVIDFLTASDATLVGLDKQIKSYNSTTILDPTADTLLYTNIPRIGGYRQGHHISQINVTESDGKRYVYGIPVYNTKQQDFTFTVNESNLATPGVSDTVVYQPAEQSPLSNPAVQGGTGSRDGYAEITQTPAYAHSFLLSGLLSPDYVDVTGNGITDDDLGSAVKFNYTQVNATHRWRTPAGSYTANFNAGTRSQVKDDKGMVTYGERESWYLHSIESKTMIAIFKLESRNDGKGVTDSTGGINAADNSSMALQEIDLYSKSDLKQNGLAGAKPIKTVHFSYSYTLCQGTRDNVSGGKLTLDSIYFTFNGQNRSNKDKYAFSYVDSVGNGNETLFGNPNYTFNASDRWGIYKPANLNPAGLRNSDFPYTPQNQLGSAPVKPALDTNAAAWSLKRILLPSGGQLEIGYESGDYGYVQNLRAMDMMTVAGFGSSPTAMSNRLYDILGSGIRENNYLFVNVPVACHSANDVYQKYLQGVSQLSVKLPVNMPAGMEWVPSYATIDSSISAGYGMVDSTTIWIKLAEVNGIGPLSLTAVEYLKEQLPAEAFPGYDVSQGSGLEQIADALVGMLDGLKSAFSDPLTFLRSQGMAQTVQLNECFARLNDPDGIKYGGGQRVKCIKLKDNWQVMTGQFNSVYTQTYDYTTTEVFNDSTRTISSGVASYEPGIGGDENPFQTIVQVEDKLPLGPTSYGAVEMPVLEPFFPAPVVGYSQVTVRSLTSLAPGSQQKSMSAIGRQVTEFYTAKDYPVYYSNTPIDPSTDLEAHDASTTNFFYQYAFDSRALSQGFLVAINDMHGKMKSQSSYAANDTTLRVNYTQNFYRNTGVNGLSELFNFVASATGGGITTGNLGIDIELMTDTRQFTVNSSSLDVQGQVDLFPVILPFWLPFIWPVAGSSENNYRAVTTTKVISYHSVLDSVVVYDKGSAVSTKNLLYDGETGMVVVTRANNEFDQPVFTTNYPAWWAYNGMGPAYQNTEVRYNNPSVPLNFTSGLLVGGTFNTALLESGDELLVTSPNPQGPACPGASPPLTMLWVLDLNKNNPPFPVTTPSFIFIDSAGNPYTNTNVTGLRVIRSGRRNMLDQNVATVTSMVSPIVMSGSSQVLSVGVGSNVISATATDFSEKWQNDIDAFPTFTLVNNPSTCTSTLTQQCNGTLLESAVNPYRRDLLGDFRPQGNLVFYGSRNDSNIAVGTNLPQNGFLANFTPYWSFNTSDQLVPNTTSSLWLQNTQTTRYNAKGLELETKNALNIHTAAQYGYNKSVPVAITQNASYYQTAYEGFEDLNFSQTVDASTSSPCPVRQIGFSSMPNTYLVDTDTTSFNAHTGKYVLGVTHNNTASLSIPIVPSDNLNYTLQVGSATTQLLANTGVNYSFSPTYPNSFYFNTPTVASSSSSVEVLTDMWINSQTFTNSGGNWDGYIQILNKNTYQFVIGVSSNYNLNSGLGSMSNGITLEVTGVTTSGFHSMYVAVSASGTNVPSSQAATLDSGFTLCPGLWHVQASFSNNYSATNASDSHDQYQFNCTNCSGTLYMNTTTQNGCTSTTPIPASTTMMNPAFSMPAGVPMVLSAWVRETPATTGSGADTATSYTKDQILVFDGSNNNTLYPTGPIIEGWQRYEGYFTPASSGTASVSFVNNSGNTIYFDDIRIHPFNADMKSYVYDPVSLRLIAELDPNNYATFYEYDEEGTLVRKKAETQQGIQTLQETRSAKQKNITTIQ
jgi:hypothetical protein